MPANSHLTPTCVHYFITTEIDPGVISRVTEIFAIRGLMPDLFKVSRYKKTGNISEILSIDIRVSGQDPNEQDLMLTKLAAIVSVHSVRKEIYF